VSITFSAKFNGKFNWNSVGSGSNNFTNIDVLPFISRSTASEEAGYNLLFPKST
jgi:hypothetical protein